MEPTNGTRVFVSSSPSLVDGPHWKLYECPLSMLDREAPWVWDVLSVQYYAEHGGLEIMRQSRFLRDAVRLVSAEKGRHLEELHNKERRKTDAAYAANVLKRGG